jgi:hypothetical protein
MSGPGHIDTNLNLRISNATENQRFIDDEDGYDLHAF